MKTPLAVPLTVALSPLLLAAAPSAGGLGSSVREAFEAWGKGEGSIYDLMDAETEIVIPGTLPHCGVYRRDAFLTDVAAPFLSRFSKPPVPRLSGLWSDANSVVVTADATGTTRERRPYANDYVFVFEFNGQRLSRVTELLDMAAFNLVWDSVAPAASA